MTAQEFKPNEIYLDLEKTQDSATPTSASKSQIELWCEVTQTIKMGIVNNHIPINELQKKFKIQLK